MTHKGTKTIETDRLILRKFVEDDAIAAYNNWTSDDKVTEFLRWPTHTDMAITESVINDWIAESENDDFYQWAIVLKELNEPIGVIEVVDKNESLNMLHIEYCIGHSGNVMKKCGLVYEGTLRQADYSNKGIVDACIYSILKDDWVKSNE